MNRRSDTLVGRGPKLAGCAAGQPVERQLDRRGDRTAAEGGALVGAANLRGVGSWQAVAAGQPVERQLDRRQGEGGACDSEMGGL